jgi:hypothetical protein
MRKVATLQCGSGWSWPALLWQDPNQRSHETAKSDFLREIFIFETGNRREPESLIDCNLSLKKEKSQIWSRILQFAASSVRILPWYAGHDHPDPRLVTSIGPPAIYISTQHPATPTPDDHDHPTSQALRPNPNLPHYTAA